MQISNFFLLILYKNAYYSHFLRTVFSFVTTEMPLSKELSWLGFFLLLSRLWEVTKGSHTDSCQSSQLKNLSLWVSVFSLPGMSCRRRFNKERFENISTAHKTH